MRSSAVSLGRTSRDSVSGDGGMERDWDDARAFLPGCGRAQAPDNISDPSCDEDPWSSFLRRNDAPTEMAGVGIWVGNLEEEPEREDDTSATPVVGDPAFEGALTSLADMVTGEGGAVAVRTVTVSCFAELEANVGLADVDRTGTVTLNRLRALLLPPEGFALPELAFPVGAPGGRTGLLGLLLSRVSSVFAGTEPGLL